MSTQYDPRETGDSLMNKRLSEKDKELIRHLYVDQNMSLTNIATETGHSVRWILRYIKTNNLRQEKTIRRQEDFREYWEDRNRRAHGFDDTLLNVPENTPGKKAEKLLTEEIKQATKPWKNYYAEVKHNGAPRFLWLNFGVLVDASVGKDVIRLVNDKREVLQISKKRMFKDIEDTDRINTQWSHLSSKVVSNLGKEVAVNLDGMVYLKPTYAVDVTELSLINKKLPVFDKYAGSEELIDAYEAKRAKYAPRPSRKNTSEMIHGPFGHTFSEEKKRGSLMRQHSERQKAEAKRLHDEAVEKAKGDQKVGALLDGKAMSLPEIDELVVTLNQQRDGLFRDREAIEEKLKFELERMDNVMLKARANYDRAVQEAQTYGQNLEQVKQTMEGVKRDMSAQLTTIEKQMNETEERIGEVTKVAELIRKFKADNEAKGKPVNVKATAQVFGVEAQAKASSAKAMAEAAEAIAMEQGPGMNLTESQLAQIADRLFEKMQPAVPAEPAEKTYSQAEMDAVMAQARAAEERARAADLVRAADRRAYMTSEENRSLKADVAKQIEENENTNKRDRKRAIQILEDMGDDLYVGTKRITINSNKVSNNLALRAGVPNIKGAINVDIKEPYFAYENQSETNAYYCDLPDFGKTCIVAIMFKDNSREDMVASSIMSDRVGWLSEENKVRAEVLGKGGKQRTDVSSQEWAEMYVQIDARLDFADVDVAE